jgi:ribosomal protein S18 acetylase RimI-like enzyme
MSDSEPPLDLPVMIRQMRMRDMRPFMRLRALVDTETPYMPSVPGERKESLLYNLAKMYWNRKKVFTYLAYKDDELVGYIILLLGRFRKFRGNAYIANVSVRKDCRGQGIGRELMKAAEKQAKQCRARRVELEVFGKNENAIRLYEQLGYEVEGRKRRAVENEDSYDDLVFMAKFI